MPFTIDTSDVIAFFAFCLALYSTVKTRNFNQRQQQLIDTQNELSKLLLRKEQHEALEGLSADLSASFIKLGSNSRRLKVFNKGKKTARNIRLEFPDGNDLVIKSDINSKFPLDTLEQFQSVELLATSEFGSPSKLTVKLTWDDELKKDNSKILTITT